MANVPDVEQLIYAYLAPLVGIDERVYTVIPKEPTFPLIVVTRIGGSPVSNVPLHLDRALMQIDVYGGAKATTHDLAATARQLLAAPGFIGEHEVDGDPIGVVTGIEFGIFRWLPDATYAPPKPRYQFDLAAYVHAA